MSGHSSTPTWLGTQPLVLRVSGLALIPELFTFPSHPKNLLVGRFARKFCDFDAAALAVPVETRRERNGVCWRVRPGCRGLNHRASLPVGLGDSF